MIKIQVNGKYVDVDNLETFGFKSNFEDRISEAEMTFDEISIVNPHTSIIDEWINTYGVGVGIPSSVEFGGINIPCYIDLMDGFIKYERRYTVKLKKRKGLDAFFDFADGATFEWLASQGVDFGSRKAKYLIVPTNQGEQALTLFLGIALTSKAIAEQIREIAYLLTANSIEATGTDPIHVASTISANIVRISLNVAMLVLYSVLFADLISKFKELVYPKVRGLNWASYQTLIQKACEYKGYSFQSTLLADKQDLGLIPVPIIKKQQSIFRFIENDRVSFYNHNYPTSLDSVSTLGQLFSALETKFNAEVKVNNGVVRLETRSYWQNTASMNFVEAFNVQENLESKRELNTNESFLRYYTHFQTDFSDIHTLNDFDNTVSEYGIKNNIQQDEDLNLLKGLYDVNIPFALGSVKTELTFAENTLRKLFSKIDELLGTNTSVYVYDRVNILQISEQFFSTTKFYAINNAGKVSENYGNYSAKNIFDNFHRSEVIDQNGWEKFEGMPMVMDETMFTSLFDNSYVTMNGTSVKVLSIDWNPRISKGIVNYKKSNNYASGKISIFAIT